MLAMLVQDLVLVEATAQRDDDILAHHAGTERALEAHTGDGRHLPPGLAGCPDGRRVGAHDGRAQRGHRAVDVRVRIAGHRHATRRHVPLLDHHLVADAGAGRVEVDAVLLGELLYAPVFGEVFLGLVLNVVVDGEYRLPGVGNFVGTDRFELRDDRAGVVVRHHVLGPYGHVVTRMDGLSLRESDRVPGGNFFDNGLTHDSSVDVSIKTVFRLQQTDVTG
jgi:hypothetical protein